MVIPSALTHGQQNSKDIFGTSDGITDPNATWTNVNYHLGPNGACFNMTRPLILGVCSPTNPSDLGTTILYVSGNANIKNNVIVGGDLDVTQTATFNADVSVDQNLYVGNTATITNLNVINSPKLYSVADESLTVRVDNAGYLLTSSMIKNDGVNVVDIKGGVLYITGTRIGINRTDPAYSLDVSGAARVVHSIGVANNFFVDPYGRVGIGTSSPTRSLDVIGDTKIYGALTVDSVGSTNTLYTNNGKVGIGTSSPNESLQVVGSVFSDALKLSKKTNPLCGTCTSVDEGKIVYDGSFKGCNGVVWSLIAGDDNCPSHGVCGGANGKSRVFSPTTDRCQVGNASAVTIGTTGYTWTCAGQNSGTNASCSGLILKQPTSYISYTTGGSIAWSWFNGGGVPTKYVWTNNISDQDVAPTTTYTITYTENSLTVGTTYSNRKVKACDDLNVCTSFINLPTTTCAGTFPCTGICTGTYTTPGKCNGIVMGSVSPNDLYEGQSCEQFFTSSLCSQGMLTHGCSRNETAITSHSCSEFSSQSSCTAKSGCSWECP